MSREQMRIRPEKESLLEEIKETVRDSSYVWVADFTGLDMAATTELRCRLRNAGATYRVVRNRLLQKAAESPELTEAARALTGATALVTGEGDGVEVARALLGFIKENERPALKTSVFDGAVLAPEDVRALGDLPAMPVLQAMLAGVLAAPMTRLAGVLHQKVSSLVYVLKAVEEKKQAAGSAAPAA